MRIEGYDVIASATVDGKPWEACFVSAFRPSLNDGPVQDWLAEMRASLAAKPRPPLSAERQRRREIVWSRAACAALARTTADGAIVDARTVLAAFDDLFGGE